MKAIQISDWGDPGIMQIKELPTPKVKDDEVLVKVQVCSINPIDLKIRRGDFSDFYPLPLIPGAEFMGTVAHAGQKCNSIEMGTEIFGFTSRLIGCYTDYVIAKENELVPIPKGIDKKNIAAIPLVASTAKKTLEKARLQKEDRVLVHGGAGSVAYYAIQLANQIGAKVLVACRTDQKDQLNGLPINELLFYEDDFYNRVRELDVILDLVGGEIQQQSFPLLKPGGRLISTVMPPNPGLVNQYDVEATMLQIQPEASTLYSIKKMLEEEQLTHLPVSSFSLEDVVAVHQMIEDRKISGKVVLTV